MSASRLFQLMHIFMDKLLPSLHCNLTLRILIIYVNALVYALKLYRLAPSYMPKWAGFKDPQPQYDLICIRSRFCIIVFCFLEAISILSRYQCHNVRTF